MLALLASRGTDSEDSTPAEEEETTAVNDRVMDAMLVSGPSDEEGNETVKCGIIEVLEIAGVGVADASEDTLLAEPLAESEFDSEAVERVQVHPEYDDQECAVAEADD